MKLVFAVLMTIFALVCYTLIDVFTGQIGGKAVVAQLSDSGATYAAAQNYLNFLRFGQWFFITIALALMFWAFTSNNTDNA